MAIIHANFEVELQQSVIDHFKTLNLNLSEEIKLHLHFDFKDKETLQQYCSLDDLKHFVTFVAVGKHEFEIAFLEVWSDLEDKKPYCILFEGFDGNFYNFLQTTDGFEAALGARFSLNLEKCYYFVGIHSALLGFDSKKAQEIARKLITDAIDHLLKNTKPSRKGPIFGPEYFCERIPYSELENGLKAPTRTTVLKILNEMMQKKFPELVETLVAKDVSSRRHNGKPRYRMGYQWKGNWLFLGSEQPRKKDSQIDAAFKLYAALVYKNP
eukprot:augustus_masked-scaffold_6-processed-gene-18.64-mRNA-1 protein AED:1.00 eAED:1.00 QI:0/-1/0/0/-1/1/1/0/268